ncbi:MAG: cupredoxin family copper-binding protein [Acidobacteria bacterium]|nr:cupredoxin family copper-binding protein [Acidobacteriota bacterium]
MKNRRMKTALVAALFGSVLMLGAWWLARAAQPAAAAAANEVSINNTQFEPKTLTVAKGATVTWTNKEAKPHTVTADDNSFASKVMKENETYSYKFEKPGTYAYHCAFHGGNAGKGMAGTIVVK